MLLGVMGCTCNPNYLGGGDWKDCSSSLTWAKSLQDPISTNKLGVVVHVCNTNYAGVGLGCSSVIEHLPSMHEALGSIPGTKKRKDQKTKLNRRHR
jgi:hypothetical protein